MNKRGHIGWIAVAVALLPLTAAAADPAEILSSVHSQAAQSLAVLEYEVEGADGQTNRVTGVALCLDGKGTFLTVHLSARLPIDRIKDGSLTLRASGVDATKVPATLLGIDPVSGLGFVRTQNDTAAPWRPARLANRSLAVGQPVVSVGLSAHDPARPAVAGLAYVGGVLRVPQRIVQVTGGTLTALGSPVFSADGKMIGLVMEQLPEGSQMLTRGGQTNVRLQAQQQTSYFTPLSELVHVLNNIPVKGKVRRPPWIGIAQYDTATEELLSLHDNIDRAVAVGKVIPETPADRAGIDSGELIVSLNGQPLEKMATPQLTMQNFVRQMRRLKRGATVKLGIVGKDGRTREVPVTVEDMPKRPDEAPRLLARRLGFEVREKVPLDRYLTGGATAGVPGLLVTRVDPRGPAAQALPSLQPDDLIVQANGKKVETTQGLREIIEAAREKHEALELDVRAGNDARKVRIVMPR